MRVCLMGRIWQAVAIMSPSAITTEFGPKRTGNLSGSRAPHATGNIITARARPSRQALRKPPLITLLAFWLIQAFVTGLAPQGVLPTQQAVAHFDALCNLQHALQLLASQPALQQLSLRLGRLCLCALSLRGIALARCGRRPACTQRILSMHTD